MLDNAATVLSSFLEVHCKLRMTFIYMHVVKLTVNVIVQQGGRKRKCNPFAEMGPGSAVPLEKVKQKDNEREEEKKVRN